MTDTSGASGHQKLRVCDVCGAYLSVLDSDRRLADHFGGKASVFALVFVAFNDDDGAIFQMHLGYHELRNMLNKFREEREKRKMAPPPQVAPNSPSGPVAGPPARSGASEFRTSRDDYRDRDRDRDRDRGYERHSSSRYE